LSAYTDKTLVEMSGGTPFPPIREQPYMLSLGGYGFLWFLLRPRVALPAVVGPASVPLVEGASLDSLLLGRMPKPLEGALLGWLRERRWFRGKARKTKGVRMVDRVALSAGEP